MFSPLTAQMIEARQREIEARAAHAHHLDALRDLRPQKEKPRRHFRLRAPSLALFGARVARRA